MNRVPSTPVGTDLPTASVVIPCYNASPYLAETVASVVAQTLRDFEVFIVDDGSTDGSLELARELAGAHPEVPITVIEIPHSGHPAYPRNAGLALTRAPIVTCLDPDDKFTPDYLERCVATLEAEPEVGLTYGDLRFFGAEDRFWLREEYDFQQLTRRNLIGANAVFRRQAWVDTGGFDPSLPYEDWNFWIECGVHGYLGRKTHGTEWLYRIRPDSRFRTFGSPRDRRTKASFVVRRPQLYTTAQLLWARAVLEENPLADTVRDHPGVIPELSGPPARPPLPATPPPAHPRPSSAPEISGSPLVSVVIPAYNLARFLRLALDSALAQDFPGEVEVIVIDDGSTDETPAVLASYGDRIRTLRQENAGLVAATQRGLELVRGDYVALLDADDEWPRDRLYRHVAALQANPQLGLVHGDMELIDQDGGTISPSFFAYQGIRPSSGRVLGRLIADNFVTQSAITFRAELLPAVLPFAPDIRYPDWWLASCAAAVSEVGLVDGPAARYRYHGGNMNLGSDETKLAKLLRDEIPWRRHLLTQFAGDDAVTPENVWAAVGSFSTALAKAAAGAEAEGESISYVRDPDACLSLLATPPVADGRGSLTKALARAYTLDPTNPEVIPTLMRALPVEQALRTSPSPPLLAVNTRPTVWVTWLDQLLADPGLLDPFTEQAETDPELTLVVLAPPDAEISQLVALVEGDPLLSDDRIDMTVLTSPATPVAERLLSARATARLGEAPHGTPFTDLPAARVAAGTR